MKDKKPHIIHLTKQKEGGAGEYAQRLSDSLNLRGFYKSVCFYRNDFRESKDSIRTVAYKIVRKIINSQSSGVIHGHLAAEIKGLEEAIKDADIVHLHSINDWLDLSVLSRVLKGKKVVWTLHGFWNLTGGCVLNNNCYAYNQSCNTCPYLKESLLKKLHITRYFLQAKRKFIDKIDYIIPNSVWVKNEIENSYASNKCASQTVYPIINNSFEPTLNHQKKNKYKYTIGVCASSLTDENKNILRLLDFINRSKDSYFKDVLFLLAGEGKLPIDHDNINISYLGSQVGVEQMKQFYNSLDLFVSPSLSETFGMTIVEAQFCGIPVVTFDNGALGETFQHKKTGYLVTNDSFEEFTEGIKWTLSNLINAKKEISQLSKYKFSSDNITQKQEDIYKSLLNTLSS